MARKDIFTASKEKKRKKLFLKIGIFVFGILVFISGLIYFLTLPKFTVQTISIEGNTSVGNDDIEAEVKSALQDKTLFFFKGNNIFFLSKNNIEKRLLEKFSRLKTVAADRDFFNTLVIKITERNQKALFCAGRDDGNSAGKCAFADEDGLVFEKAPYFSGDVYVKFFDERDGNVEKNITDIVAERNLKIGRFGEIMDFIGGLKKMNISPASVIFKNEDLFEIKVTEDWVLQLNNRIDLETALNNLKLAMENQIKGDRSKLEYVYLRLDNKVFSKFK